MTLAEDYEIPSFSESIVRVFIQRENGSYERSGEVLIEPLSEFKERHSLSLGASRCLYYISGTKGLSSEMC